MPAPAEQALIPLGAALREARVNRGETREQLAQRLGLGRGTLERIEAGAPGVAIASYLAVGQELGVPVLVPHAAKPAEIPRRATGRPASGNPQSYNGLEEENALEKYPTLAALLRRNSRGQD